MTTVTRFNKVERPEDRRGVRDTPAMISLRGRARSRLSSGEEPSKVIYDMVRDATLGGVSDYQLRKITEDLRGEGLLPEV